MPTTLVTAVALVVLVGLTGCLRVGPGEDLHLVCEEKSASPRKAYDIGFLVAQTRVEGEVDDKTRVAMLEMVRHHVITPGGREHFDFTASLAPAQLRADPEAWLFDALGGYGGGLPDVYRVLVWKEGSAWVAGAEHGAAGLVRPPHSIARPAWDAANASSAVRDARPAGSSESAATWTAALPSCVRLTYANAAEERLDVVVNVVQSRVVLIHRADGDA